MREYTREYTTQLQAFRAEKERTEQASYNDDVRIIVSSLIAQGENTHHIAGILGVNNSTVVRWYRDLILNEAELAFGMGDFTYIRDKNKLRADARTIGCVIKAIDEEILTIEEAMEAVGVNTSKRAVQGWINKYGRDFNVMLTMPPGTEYAIRTTYATTRADADELQALIYQHDLAENELSSQRKAEDRALRG